MSITVTGMDQLIQILGRVAAIETLEAPMQRSLYRLQAFMQVYPAAPAHSKYIRGYGFPHRPKSEKYGQRWTTKIDRNVDGLIGRVGNNASYGPYVGSARFQTRFHARTGWHTDQQALNENEAAIVADFGDTINRAIGAPA